MKAEKSKRNFWTNSEIDCMLNLIKVVRLTHESTGTTHHTFVQIASKMRKRGFPNKSPTQIRRKWFQMKSAYLCYKRGNTERLLLIPERFRSVIAEFVEADLITCGKKAIQMATEDPPVIRKFATVVRKESPPARVNPNVEKEEIIRNEPVIRKEQIIRKEPITQKEPLTKIDHSVIMEEPIKMNHFIKNVQLNKAVDVDPPKSSYDKKFSKLMAHIKQTHSFVNSEFQRMQEGLMAYEQNCQRIRDTKLIEFMETITFKNSYEIPEDTTAEQCLEID